jgi:acyl-CoA reductase-like NAD-dependent aldehyde dehydrogenase
MATALPDGTGYTDAMNWIKSGPKRLLIGGRWVDANSGATRETINPATEEVLAQVAEAGAEDVDAAVVAAQQAMKARSWNGISPHARTHLLLKITAFLE